MQINQHVYRMPLFRSIVIIAIGVFFTACSLLLLILLLPGLRRSLTGLENIVGQIFMAAVYLVFPCFFGFLGISLILQPVYCRLIIASDGMEYQTFLGSLKSTWVDVYKMDIPLNSAQPRMMVLASRKPQIHLRGWTRFVPWNIRRGFALNGIHLDQFGKLHGSQLWADLNNYVPGLINALQSAPTQSPQRRVGIKTFSLKEFLKILWFFMMALTFWLVWLGQSMRLTCKHDIASGQVNCINKKSWYSKISLGTQEFMDIRDARVTYSRDSEGDIYYQVHLVSEEGDDSLLYMPMPGYVDETVEKQFNEFLQNPTDSIYVLEQKPRWLNATSVMYMIIGVALSGIWLYWPRKKVVTNHV